MLGGTRGGRGGRGDNWRQDRDKGDVETHGERRGIPLIPHSPRVAPPPPHPPRIHSTPMHAYTMSGIFAQPYSDNDNLQFYAGQPYDARPQSTPYAPIGSMGSMSGNMNMASGNILSGSGRWWEAFGTGGLDGEPSLMEGASTHLTPIHA